MHQLGKICFTLTLYTELRLLPKISQRWRISLYWPQPSVIRSLIQPVMSVQHSCMCPESRIKCSPLLGVVITLSSITPSSADTHRSNGTNRKSNSRPLPVWHSWPELPSCQTLRSMAWKLDIIALYNYLHAKPLPGLVKFHQYKPIKSIYFITFSRVHRMTVHMNNI